MGGFLAGGLAGTAFASPVQNLGNHLYFGDPLMTPKQYITGIAIGGVTGGIVNGGIAKIGLPLTGSTQSEAVQAGKL